MTVVVVVTGVVVGLETMVLLTVVVVGSGYCTTIEVMVGGSGEHGRSRYRCSHCACRRSSLGDTDRLVNFLDN